MTVADSLYILKVTQRSGAVTEMAFESSERAARSAGVLRTHAGPEATGLLTIQDDFGHEWCGRADDVACWMIVDLAAEVALALKVAQTRAGAEQELKRRMSARPTLITPVGAAAPHNGVPFLNGRS